MINKTVSTAIVVVASIMVLLLFVNIFNISYPVMVTTTTKTTEFSVVGEGKVEAVPDTAYVDVGITVNDAKTVQDAQKTINDTNNKIISSMKALGIAKTEIKTSNYSINPNYNYDGGTNNITGYNGNVTVSIKMKDTQLASRVVEEATKAGANQVQGTRFTIDNPAKFREQAREKAIQNAKEQAQALAQKLGITLGKVTNVVEGVQTGGVVPMTTNLMFAKADMAGGSAAPVIEGGSQTITSEVTLYFEKK